MSTIKGTGIGHLSPSFRDSLEFQQACSSHPINKKPQAQHHKEYFYSHSYQDISEIEYSEIFSLCEINHQEFHQYLSKSFDEIFKNSEINYEKEISNKNWSQIHEDIQEDILSILLESVESVNNATRAKASLAILFLLKGFFNFISNILPPARL